MKKIKIKLLAIIALLGVIIVMPSCEIIYDILTAPSTQVDDNSTNNDANKNSKGKTSADPNDPNASNGRN